MLTFFRKIRKALLDSGSTGKYLLYAIGEIALVVIGILIALQINNWNENRKTQDQIKKQLNTLVGALHDDLNSLRVSYDIHQWRFSSFQYLLKISGHDPLDYDSLSMPQNSMWSEQVPVGYNRDFVNTSFSWFHRGFSQLVFNR